MANEQYSPKPYLYQSRGLAARWEEDRVPEGYYLQLTNCLERSEEGMSSRYGYTILNRDPNGTPNGRNYGLVTPVVSLARLLFQGQSWRYAGTQDGTLYRRQGTGQGQFTEIYGSLSGNPFQSVVTTAYETSQAYLYIYDQAVSIADQGTGIPRLTGIDPPPYTANAQPYSPLLTLIDPFVSTTSYATSNVSGWAYGSVATLSNFVGSMVTDFPQFTLGQYTIAGGTASASAGSSTPVSNSTVCSGFSSVPATGGFVTVNFNIAWTGGGSGHIGGHGSVEVDYSVNGGLTWSPGPSVGIAGTASGGPSPYSISVYGLSNLNQLQLRITATSASGVSGVYTVSGTISSISASVTAPGVFGPVANGMLSILQTATPSVSTPIQSIVSTGFNGHVYTTLTITTQSPHGLVGSVPVAVYASSNDLCDGFYATISASGTTIVVAFVSAAYISATGGYLWANSSGKPEFCILNNLYSLPYPTQMSAWGFYCAVPTSVTSFPVSAWSGTVASNTTGSIGLTANFDLSQNDQVNDSDLIALVIKVGSPSNVSNIRLQFDVNASGYTSSYYYADISPAYYQGSIANQISAYQATQNQILADTLGLITGQPLGSTTAQLQPSNFSTGAGSWVTVYIPRGNFLPVGNAGQSGLDWTNITGWQVVVTTATTGSSTIALNGLYLQWGYGPSSFGGVGYDWRYTYFNANTGTESSPSPEQFFSEQYGYLSSLNPPFYLRQAAQITGQYSTDPQVTHLRMYRRGGIYANNWLLIDQVANVTGYGTFFYKDVIADAALAQASPLALDNDPPVTSTLITPIQTTLSQATTSPGQSVYSTYAPQVVQVADDTAVFVTNQTVLIGNAANLEEVLVVSGGIGQFSAILRLQHNAGEQVSATSVPRQAPYICALAYGQVWVVDPLNPSNVFFSKPGYPENFGPENYIPVGAPDDPVMALINWRGTLVAATLKTWKVIIGGSAPYSQPTGAAHGLIATQGWTLVEGEIWYRAADGLRAFTGADGVYMTLPVEWIYRATPPTLVPKANPATSASDVLAYYQNCVYDSYVSENNGQRYRLVYDVIYKRFRLDDIPATAMLWEQDTNVLLVGRPITSASSAYGVVQDWTNDYDDGGWVNGALVQTPINLTIQVPYKDLGRPHFPKQFNVLEGDYDTANQPITTTLLFNTEPQTSLALPNQTTTQREKVQYQIENGDGYEAYSMSILHTMAVTKAPTLYQENVYAVLLADWRTSFDTYWSKFEGDLLGILPKDAYFDYSATAQIAIQLFADGEEAPYYTDSTTLIPQTGTLSFSPVRSTVRVQFPARKGRLWRMVLTSSAAFQLWSAVKVEVKNLEENSGYAKMEFEVYE